jgi:ankyrin repeat protein
VTQRCILFCSEVNVNLFVERMYDGNIDTAADMLDVSDVNLQVVGGLAALHAACMHGHVDIVRMLLSQFASTDITDDNRQTPAMLC